MLLLTGAGSVRSDYERLLAALRDIAGSYGPATGIDRTPRSFEDLVLEATDLPLEGESVPLYQADGRVLYEPVITYPPGTPIACPGEIMNMRVISLISDILAAGDAITGVDEEGMIRVGSVQ